MFVCPYVWRDSRCPQNCANDTMRLISLVNNFYVTNVDYANDLLHNITLLMPQQRLKRDTIVDKKFDIFNTEHANTSNPIIYQFTYFDKQKKHRGHCSPCNLYYNIKAPVRNSSYVMDIIPQYIDSMEPTNPIIHINRTQGISSEISYQTQHRQYHVSSLVNASWLSQYAMCGNRNMFLLPCPKRRSQIY